MLRWIKHLRTIAQRSADHFPDEAAREEVLATYSAAEARYRKVARDANIHWEDEMAKRDFGTRDD
jgi:hypothetical protein